MNEDITLPTCGDVGVDPLKEEVIKDVKDDQNEATPAGDDLKSQDEEISDKVENAEGEASQKSDEKRMKLKKENGAGDKVQLDGEVKDHDTNKTTEKSVGNETDTEDMTSVTEEEPTKPLNKHCGEGDAHHIEEAEARDPSITAQDTPDSREDARQSDFNKETVEQLKKEDGAGNKVQLDGEGKDHGTNKSTEKRKSDVLDPAPSQEISQGKSPPEESVNDVSNETDTEDKISVTEEEPTKPFKEHLGDAHHIEKAEAREPSTTAQDTPDSKSPYIYVFAAVVVAVLAYWLLRFRPPPVQKPFNLLEVFRHEMDMLESSFPSQHKELWRRSRIHLLRHLNLSQPSEPVSLILTSGRGAEKTLGCLAQQLAAAFSTARNASALDIDGTSKTTEDSDQVKLDIDRALKEAFDGGKQAVVIHRFEELPPGSTLIFYRYCDHENAAYKDVFLAFTVLLEEELVPSHSMSLGMVEEIVQEYLKDKFVSSERTATFNQMDVDKLSGLWSRISHLILPVSAEERIEQHGCERSG